ncbi:MAG: transcription-repair coupling factor, partial [Rhodocyclaceae bacterium]|nr:transcription-repair coupling factor [Rhodocyclaceae bacterium]
MSQPTVFIQSSDSLLLARAARQTAPVMILAADASDAERLATEIAWFDPTLRVCRLPDWETLPYDHFSPHPDLVSERISTLYRLSRGDFDVGIVPVTTAMTRLAPREYLAGRAFLLRIKTPLDLEVFRNDLSFGGYTSVNQVMAPGEYAI